MRRILFFILVIAGLKAEAQVYNNEWIDYNKTYYKFKVGASGLYRITQSTLSSIGWGATAVENFQLWRNGKEIPLYTSVQTGPMGSSDYIEFWGEMNDGKPDKALYRDPDYQLNDKWSLQTDTAVFFLTVNPSSSNLRLSQTPNNISGSPTPEPYFMCKVGKYYKDQVSIGLATSIGASYVYYSSYDQGEGWTSPDIDSAGFNSTSQTNLSPYTGAGAPQSSFSINAAGNAQNARTFHVKINGTEIMVQGVDYYNYVKVSTAFNTSLLSSGTANVDIVNAASAHPDRMDIAQYEITYPRQFNFGGVKSFFFDLPANVSGNYLEISNFNYGGTAPILYDLTNGKSYVADISNPSLIKIALQPSAVDRKLLLVSEDASNVQYVTSFQQRNFVNLTQSANQGNYLIITNSALLNGSNGTHPVDDYRAYRSSAAGGGYNAKVYLIDDLIDQFAFGIKMHPLSIRNFLSWARANFSGSIKDVLLIGKGTTYNLIRSYETSSLLSQLCFLPTFGNPGSDILLSASPGTSVPLTPIGRLSVITADEITPYLNKVKQYEQAQASSSPTILDKAWMKNVIHVVGGNDPVLQPQLDLDMQQYKQIIIDTLYGGYVTTFTKTSTEAVEQLTNNEMATLFQQGIGMFTYFGHSASNVLDFNIGAPEDYNNTGKYPIMIVMGCDAGDFFTFNAQRLQTKETISEQYVLSNQHGAIAFIASTGPSIVQYLDIYNNQSYNSISRTQYGKTIGEIMQNAINGVFTITGQNDQYARLHCEENSLHGDPALRFNNSPKPDYAIEDPLVKISPSFISVADSQFVVKATMMNLGKAIGGKVIIEVKRTYPNLPPAVIERDTIPAIKYSDSLTFNIPIVPLRDKGLNKITITIDPDNVIDELYENNNSITKDVMIYETEANLIYPYNYAIVNNQNIKLAASTANPFDSLRQYVMELDTTLSFNSPYKVTQNKNSSGGELEFTPGITFTDSTVYYWRVAPVPSSGPLVWNTASFVYLPGPSFGYNQSHTYQHLASDMQRVYYDTLSHLWKYKGTLNNIYMLNGVYPDYSAQQSSYTISLNNIALIGPGCNYDEIIFNVIDPNTFKPWKNDYTGPTGLYKSLRATCGTQREYNFEYMLTNPTSRKDAMDFLDLIPDGYFITVRGNINPISSGNTYPNVWKNDTTMYGSGNSLYHKLYNQGFYDLDSLNRPRGYGFIYKKNSQSIFPPVSKFSPDTYTGIAISADCVVPDTLGFITSPAFGPAKAWKQIKWRGSTDATPGDVVKIDVIGIDINGNQTTLFSGLNLTQQDFDISSVSATTYPYLKLKMTTQDSINSTPYQLRYWRILYTPVPEGAIAPNLYFSSKDTVDIGEPLDFKVAFKNVSEANFDSLKIKLTVTDKNNVTTIVPVSRRKPLFAGITDTVEGIIKTANLPGSNSMYIEVNSDNDQPEQFHNNNFAYRNFFVKPDSLNPLLDVTFDGVHILNRDIVASKPAILVKLKDEAKWMVLDDTSLVSVKVQYPDGTIHQFSFSNDTLKFIPAGQAPNLDNTASVNFAPYFQQDGEYQLIVTGKDRSNNTAGNIEYRVAFEIINKPMISNMLNYPNPFTTSTAFVFTLTGSEVPQNIKIEIMTITGKIVKEITKDELGPLRIGRNITEYKWDGTDQYGQKLANGIYLYRVVTNLNGKSLDKYKSDDDNTDKYFNKGYGKMYLMR